MYSPDFFDFLSDSSTRSADAVVPLLIDMIRPDSVVDVGCGVGSWLSAFQRAGVTDIVGLDGDYVPTKKLLIDPQRFVAQDVTAPFALGRRFDLAISLEVAEHLEPECAADFVAKLCQLSDNVVFSAAIPEQGGTDHRNEQWPSYWIELFAAHGYGFEDSIRPVIWNDDRVSVWFRQNILRFSRNIPVTKGDLGTVDRVHPQWFMARIGMERSQGIVVSSQRLAGAVGRRLRRAG